MRRQTLIGLAGLFIIAALAGCNGYFGTSNIAEFWRPISEPNVQMPLEKAQVKLNFDLSQCRCGIYPTNITQAEQTEFMPDRQRLNQTSVTVTSEDHAECLLRPSLVVTECMRARGWEVTKCSGRMPLAGGGALCSGYAIEESDDE